MSEVSIEEMIKLKSEISKQIMRDISALVEKLNEAGESNFMGSGGGWLYTFTRTEEIKPESLT